MPIRIAALRRETQIPTRHENTPSTYAPGGARCRQRALTLWVFLSITAGAVMGAPASGENLRVLDFWKSYSDAPNALYKEIAAEAYVSLRARQNALARLNTADEWEQYRQQTREKLMDLAGPFPDRTPLNARVLGVVKKDDFRIEKIVYESQPGLFVTAALFVPEPLQGKAPAILYCSGHTPAGFRNAPYQHVILNLVKRGFIVLAFDPINQGERLQFLNPESGKSDFGSSSLGHSYAAAPTFVLGSSLARLMIWDGIRGVDYLVSRGEVDARRLGITGRSGGGTQTAYIAAVDDRLLAAAPENYLTTFEQLLKSRGPQDAEQNFHRGIARGFDQADFLIARAPKPAIILATTRDIFSIEGTMTVFGEGRRAFRALGQEAALTLSVDDAGHESTRKNREATYAFFQRHLELPGDAKDLPVEQLTAGELQVTETGHLATSLRGETILSLNQREATRLSEQLDARRRDPVRHLSAVKTAAARLAGYERLPAGPQQSVFSGRYQRDGYAVEKHLLPVDERYAIPLLVMVPPGDARAGVALYLHPEGKAAAAPPGGEMESLVRQGWVVVAPDLIGTGELGPGYLVESVGEHGPFLPWFGYVLMGRSIVGRQMQDLTRTVRYIEQRFGVPAAEIAGIARGAAAPVLLHAAAIEGIFAKVALIEPLLSYRSLCSSRLYPLPFLQASVPAALTAYDLPDLAACLAPRRLLLAHPCEGSGRPADAAVTARETAVITRAYSTRGDEPRFVLLGRNSETSLPEALAAWLK